MVIYPELCRHPRGRRRSLIPLFNGMRRRGVSSPRRRFARRVGSWEGNCPIVYEVANTWRHPPRRRGFPSRSHALVQDRAMPDMSPVSDRDWRAGSVGNPGPSVTMPSFTFCVATRWCRRCSVLPMKSSQRTSIRRNLSDWVACALTTRTSVSPERARTARRRAKASFRWRPWNRWSRSAPSASRLSRLEVQGLSCQDEMCALYPRRRRRPVLHRAMVSAPRRRAVRSRSARPAGQSIVGQAVRSGYASPARRRGIVVPHSAVEHFAEALR